MKKTLLLTTILFLSLSTLAHAAGFGNWKFGMTLAETKAVADCAAYVDTDDKGCYCENYNFFGKKHFIDFYYDNDKLNKISITLWEQNDGVDKAALQAGIKEASDYLTKNFGSLIDPDDKETTGDAAFATFSKMLDDPKREETIRVQFKPKNDPKDFFTFVSVIHSNEKKHGIVNIYFQPPREAGK